MHRHNRLAATLLGLALFSALLTPAMAQQGVTGKNVTTVTHSAGQFKMIGPKQWIEEASNGSKFNFVEDSRSDRIVNLSDATRGVRLQIDLQQNQILFSDTNNPQFVLYKITNVAIEPTIPPAYQPVVPTAQPVLTHPRGGELAACRANAEATNGSPTRFVCNWPVLLRTSPGSSLTGFYDARERHFTGHMSILEGGKGPPLVAVETTFRTTRRQCIVKGTAFRDADGGLVAASDEQPGCQFRITSTGRNIVHVSAQNCDGVCGMGATFEGNYHLRTGR